MNRTIWKYQLRLGPGPQEIQMPGGAEVLHVAFQGETLRMWVQVYPDALIDLRVFEVQPTGWAIEDVRHHVGTAMDGDAVWHVFEVFGQ